MATSQVSLPVIPVQEGVEVRHIPGFPGYAASKDGRVWSCRPRNGRGGWSKKGWRELSPSVVDGYKHFTFHVNRKRVTVSNQLAVMLAFVGPRPEGLDICHNDGNGLNNHLDNLRYDTPQANQNDKHRHGTMAKGAKQWKAKLNDEKVAEIRRLRATTSLSLREIGRRFGVAKRTVLNVVHGTTWK